METVIDIDGEINALSVVTAQINEGIKRIETVSHQSLIRYTPIPDNISIWISLILAALRRCHSMLGLPIYVDLVHQRHESRSSTT